MTRDQEIWAMALWVEKHHGDDGQQFIAQHIARLAGESDAEGVELWVKVKGALLQLARPDRSALC